MNCDCCTQEIKEDFTLYNDCVLLALEKIKNHYLFVKNVVKNRDEKLALLQLRNEKLVRAVELLQKEMKRTAQASPRKRRKANVTPSLTIDLSAIGDHHVEDSAAIDKTADDLNMALNSEQIFDCSDATQWSPPHNEIIGETEVLTSSRVLHTSFDLRRKLRENNFNDENKKPNSANVGAVVKMNTDGWIEKGKKPPQSDVKKSTRVDRNESFIKPLEMPKMEKKLSLKKPAKLKQTRLQLDVVRGKSSSSSDSTFCEEVIGDSPNPHKQTKPTRSWLLRTNNSGVNLSSKEERNSQTDMSCIKFNSDDDEYFENVFKYAQNITTTNNETSCKNSSSTVELAKFRLSASSPEKAPHYADKREENNESTLESVMILTPATQDIIFLDDSCINTHIESMDLVQDLLKRGDESLEHLRRIENEKIKKLQKIASTVSCQNQVTTKPQIYPSKLSLNKLPTPPKAIIKELIPIIAPTAAKIKLEKTTQSKVAPNVAASKSEFNANTDESKDLMPQPFIVKKECNTAESNVINPGLQKKLSIKEKFNIGCRDCQQYIEFLGAAMSDEEIVAHLQRCTRHQARDVTGNQTPEGFWDPFMPTFETNDPRNETLIDVRFCDKKK